MIDLAYAAAGAPGGGGPGGGLSFLIPLALMFLVFYIFLIRPQQKKQREQKDMLRSLKEGDRVMTTGGLYGTIVGGSEHEVRLEIAEKVRVSVARSHIATKVEKGDKAVAKKD